MNYRQEVVDVILVQTPSRWQKTVLSSQFALFRSQASVTERHRRALEYRSKRNVTRSTIT
jgi:hypothetical protein